MNVHVPCSRSVLISSGVLGLVGAALMLAGDLLLYAHWGDLPSTHDAIEELIPNRISILLASTRSLQISGIPGPVSAYLYLFGAWHIYQCVRPYSRVWSGIISLLFGIGFVISGSYHALWSMYGMIIQFSNGQSSVPAELLNVSRNYMVVTNTCVASVIVVASIVLFALVLFGKSTYPRWMAVMTPFAPLLLGETVLTPLAPQLGTPYSAFATGAWYNAVMVLFFALSVACAVRQTELSSHP